MLKKLLLVLPLLLANVVFMFQPFLSFAVAEEIVVAGNGSGSSSEVTVEVTNNTSIEQTNNADVNNDVSLESNTGGNEAQENTGEVSVDTGDVSQGLEIANSLNYSEVETECCLSDTEIEVSDNGSNSNNTVNYTSNNQTEISVTQNANIENNVQGTANTGENRANDNGGSVEIKTGDILVKAVVKNGPINVEKISGGQGGDDLSIVVSKNGENSENLITVLLNDLARINVNNNANIENNIDWDLNTGRNEANGNLGDVSIKTGDILFDLLVENGPINVGGIDWGCCDQEDNDDNGEDPDDPGGNGGNGGNGRNGGNGGGGGGGTSLSDILGFGSGPAVLGLSNTNGLFENPLTFWLGLILLTTGAIIYQKNFQKNKNFASLRR